MKVSVAGLAINWHQHVTSTLSDDVELIVGVRGIRQGKKPKCNDDAKRLQSQLCRNAFVTQHEHFLLLLRKYNKSISEMYQPNSTNALLQSSPENVEKDDNVYYNQYKRKHSCPMYRMIRTWIFSRESPLAGWLIGDIHNISQNSIATTYGY